MPLSLQVTKQLSADAGGSSVDAGGGSVDTELDEKEISDLPKKINEKLWDCMKVYETS